MVSLPRLVVGVIMSLMMAAVFGSVSHAQEAPVQPLALVIHGGAGNITPANLPEERRALYEAALQEALDVGYEVLENGGTSVDAVVAAITTMEESPLFNAGRGAVMTSAGTVELDASIMNGRDRNAGAVAGVSRVKSPIRLARQVMVASRHVMLVGEGAEAFAREQSLEMVPSGYFETDRRREQYERYRQRMESETGDAELTPQEEALRKYGTVGAVALDGEGNLAAGTSTGGISFKRWGRVGDSPIIGAGTYADNRSCAVSATGDGEYFIRGVVAHEISALMRYAGLSVAQAAATAVHGTVPRLGGDGGVIALDREGNLTATFTSEGMFRGYRTSDGRTSIAMFGE